jgi:hypothetical protein
MVQDNSSADRVCVGDQGRKPNTDDKYKIVDNVNDRIDDQAPNVLI